MKIRNRRIAEETGRPLPLQIKARLVVHAVLFCSLAPAAAADPACEREMTEAAREYDVPLSVLYAVGLTETGARGALNPYEINVDGRSIASANLEQALGHVTEEQARGAKYIDIGCMQINRRWHAGRGREGHCLSGIQLPAVLRVQKWRSDELRTPADTVQPCAPLGH